ncbi:MAG: hypothetical protein GYB65_23850 [Chloroflexi bacterium]|nr:hypothetical protein [Chloroflexota bacterium]
MGFDFFSFSDGLRTTRMVLLVIILLTLPCYCLGTILLVYAPEEDQPTSTPSLTPGTPLGVTSSAGITPSVPLVRIESTLPTAQPGQLQSTPTQLTIYNQPPPPALVPQQVQPTVAGITITAAPTITMIPTTTPITPTVTYTPTTETPPDGDDDEPPPDGDDDDEPPPDGDDDEPPPDGDDDDDGSDPSGSTNLGLTPTIDSLE